MDNGWPATVAVESGSANATLPRVRSTTGASRSVRHPDWIRDAALYQLHTRQFTPEEIFPEGIMTKVIV